MRSSSATQLRLPPIPRSSRLQVSRHRCRPRSTRRSGPTWCRCGAPRRPWEGRCRGRGGDLRIDRLSRLHRERLRSDPGARLGPRTSTRTSSSATAPSGSTPATASAGSSTSSRSPAARRRRRRRRSMRSIATIVPAGTHLGVVDQGRRGGQGHREHPARPQHRADERARHHLPQAGHRHERGAGGGGDQVELPAVPARPGRRPLHRRRSLLPDPPGRGDRLPPAGDPRRAADQRRHGRVCRRTGRAADDAARLAGASAAGSW